MRVSFRLMRLSSRLPGRVSGPWRSVYLQGAYELRNGVPTSGGLSTSSPDVIKAMSPEMLFDYLAVRLNGPKASGKKLVFNINFTDIESQYVLTVENAVMNYAHDRQDRKADATITLSKATLDAVQLKEATLQQKIDSGDIKIDGRKEALGELMGLLDDFPFWFNIVTPSEIYNHGENLERRTVVCPISQTEN
jgi:alkyl sulfatase BDS1-like metallo-beta-lactamase superfamily hydrolase